MNFESKVPHNTPIIIDGQSILPGDHSCIKLNVGKLPSDTHIDIAVNVYRSREPGPVILLMGGVHGDEINGIEIVRRMMESKSIHNLQRGTVITIPLLNVYGFINFSREVPDGKDVNRSFPGSMIGSLASRVARTLTKKILPYIDIALDFHTGGASRYNYPQTRVTKDAATPLALAKIFNAPFTIEKPLIEKSFRKITKSLNIPTIVFEGGESERLDGYSIDRGIQGIHNILASFEMLPVKVDTANTSIAIAKTFWIRAGQSGIFIWSKKSGHHVRKGEPLGMINSPYGARSYTVMSDREGYIIGHNNASVVNQGDALFHIGIKK